MNSKHIHKVIVVLINKYNVKMLSAQKGKKTHEMCRLYRVQRWLFAKAQRRFGKNQRDDVPQTQLQTTRCRAYTT